MMNMIDNSVMTNAPTSRFNMEFQEFQAVIINLETGTVPCKLYFM